MALGQLQIERHNHPIAAPTHQYPRRILAYLVLFKQSTRESLQEHIAPDKTRQQSQKILRQALWELRKKLPDDTIQSNHHSVSLNPEVLCDIDEFAALASNPSNIKGLYKSIELYRGELLLGFDEHWLLPLRRQWHERLLQVLKTLYQHEIQQGNYAKALALGDRLIRAEPFDESTYQAQIRLYIQLERPKAALQLSEQCQALFETELGIAVSEETHQLTTVLQQRTPDINLPQIQQNPRPIELPLIDRVQERQELLAHIEANARHAGGFILVEGVAGIGKTRLLQEVQKDAKWRHHQTIWHKHESTNPNTPFHACINTLRTYLSPQKAQQLADWLPDHWLSLASKLLPELRSWLPSLPNITHTKPDAEQMRLVEAVSGILLEISRFAPTLLIWEDIHWSDQESLQCIAFLSRKLRTRPLLIALSYRPQEAKHNQQVWSKIQHLSQTTPLSHLQLTPLSSRGTTELVRRASHQKASSPALERSIFLQSSGHPLFALELLRQRQNETVSKTETSLRVNALVQQRLAQLQPFERQVLSIASVIGSTFHMSSILKLTRQSTKQTLIALHNLQCSHFLTEEPEHYRFLHDLIQEVVYQNTPTVEKHALHKRITEILREQDDHNEWVLAHHLKQAREHKEAFSLYLRLARQAFAKQRFADANQAYQHTEELASDALLSPHEQYTLLMEREQTCRMLGERAQQRRLFATLETLLEDQSTTDWKFELLFRQAIFNSETNHPNAKQSLTRALRHVPSDNISYQAQLYKQLGRLREKDFGKNIQKDTQALQTAIQLFAQLSDTLGEANARVELARAYYEHEAFNDAIKETQRALALMEQCHTQQAEQIACLNILGSCYITTGVFLRAKEMLERSLAIAQKAGSLNERIACFYTSAHLLFAEGKMYTAYQYWLQAAEQSANIEYRKVEGFSTLCLSFIYRMLGEYREAHQTIDQATAMFCTYAIPVGLMYHDFERAETYLFEGRWEQCTQTAEEVLLQFQKASELSGEISLYCRVLLPCAIAQQDLPRARTYLKRAKILQATFPSREYLPMLRALEARVHLLAGSSKRALTASQFAMEQWKGFSYRGYLIPWIHSMILADNGEHYKAYQAIAKAHKTLQTSLAEFSPERQASSWSQVRDHKSIEDTWQTYQPTIIYCSLPAKQSPETSQMAPFVEIAWTVTHPDDLQYKHRTDRRRHQLQRLIAEADAQNAAPRLKDFATTLSVSQSTVKRDRQWLLQQKKTITQAKIP